MSPSFLLFFIFLNSCSGLSGGSPKMGKSQFSYRDVSGSYNYVREAKLIKKKIVSRTQLVSTTGGANKVVEKSITVSQIGSVKSKKGRNLTVRPLASEFTVWLEGKKYTSKMNLHPETKSLKVTMTSPEAKWNGVKDYPFPKGRYFCFFSQIPECLYHNRLLELSQSEKERGFDFYIVWDAYPYLQESYTGIGDSLFASASVKFDGKIKNLNRFVVEVEGQIILYYFKPSSDFAKLTWIAQGITVVPPGEEIKEDLE